MHRDLKPENIVLTLGRPLRVALIDFDRSLPATNTCKTGDRGTPGYQPDRVDWFDGSVMWDMYALACIVVECDLPKDEYIRAKDSRVGQQIIKKHIDSRDTCKNIYTFVDKVMFSCNAFRPPSYDTLEELIKGMKFRQHK